MPQPIRSWSDPLNNGLVKIQTSNEPSLQSALRKDEEASITINAIPGETTAKEIEAQLRQLSIKTLSLEEIIEIANRDGNEKFSEEELIALDQSLEMLLSDDREFVLTAVKKDGTALGWLVTSTFVGDREIVLEAVKQDGESLAVAPKMLQDDKEIVLAAVREDGSCLIWASKRLLNDKEVVLAAVKQHGSALSLASDSLKNDKEVVLAAIHKSKFAFVYASDKLKNNKAVVLTAARRDGLIALANASEAMRGDRDVVLTAVQQYGAALQYAAESLHGDKEIVLAAVQNDGMAFRYASKLLQNNREFVLAAVRKDGNALTFASESLRDDREIVLAAVHREGQVLLEASESLRSDREIVLAAVRTDGLAIECTSEVLRKDPDIARVAFEGTFRVYDVYQKLGEKIPGDLQSEYNSLIADFQELGISPERFGSTTLAREIINNRKNLNAPDSRPLAVIIYTGRKEKAFKHHEIEELYRRGYRVVYFEAKNEEEVYRAIETAGEQHNISFLEIGGHGSQEVIALGAGDPAHSNLEEEDLYIDLSDEEEMKKRRLSEYIKKEAVVVLNSCFTGQGQEKAPNVANMFKRIFPRAKILAPTGVSSVEGFTYIFDENNNVVDVRFDFKDRGNTYSPD